MEKSVYKYSAESGLWAGACLAVMGFCMMFSQRHAGAGLLFFVLLLVFPFLLGRGMRDMAMTDPRYRKFSAMWLYGIYTIIFGVLVSSLITGFYVTVLNPGFAHDYFVQCIDTLRNAEGAAGGINMRYADYVEELLEARMLPTGMEMIVSAAWLTCFSGSLLSLFVALVVSRTGSVARRDALTK